MSLIEENVGKNDTKNRIKWAEKRLFKTYGPKRDAELRIRLFENSCAVKIKGYRYRDLNEFVIIYYDILNGLFGVVDTNSNKLIDFSIATEVDYTDIFRYKSIFQGKVSIELIECLSNELNPFEDICPVEEGPCRKEIRICDLEPSDDIKTRGLPENYDPLSILYDFLS